MNEILRRTRISASKIKHGQGGSSNGQRRKSLEYVIWAAMIQRCHNPSNKDYWHYGGRGIVVCDEWRESFASFLAYLKRKPHQTMTLERIDNNGNYEPGNVRWATRKEQAWNRKSTRWVMLDDRQLPMSTACSILGVPYDRIRARVNSGMTFERAISLPFRGSWKVR